MMDTLRNLTALVLYTFSAEGIVLMLQHFVAINPSLVNLALFTSDVKIPHAVLRPLLAKVERLELHHTDSLMFKDVINCASPALRYFFYHPRYVPHVQDGATDEFLPLEWFAGEIVDGNVHPALEKIHVNPHYILPDRYPVGVAWAKHLLRHILVATGTDWGGRRHRCLAAACKNVFVYDRRQWAKARSRVTPVWCDYY